MILQRQRLFGLAALLVMSCELHASRLHNSYKLPRLRPRARNLVDINAATGPMDVPQSAKDVGSGRDFYKKFMLFRDMFQQPTAGNVIVITQPSTTGTPTTTTTTTPTTPTTTTTTTTTTPSTNSTSRSVGRKHMYVQKASVVQKVDVGDDDDDAAAEAAAAALLLDDRLDRLEMVQQESEMQSVASDAPKRKQKHKQQQKQKRRKHVKHRKANGAQKQVRKLKTRHRHVKRKNANKTRQKPQQQQMQIQQQPLNIYSNNNNENYNGNTSTRLQQMWQALRRQTPIERGRSQRRGRRHSRSFD